MGDIATNNKIHNAELPEFEQPYHTARRIVCEEWNRAVREYSLTPGSVTETVVSRIINRLDSTAFPTQPPPPETTEPGA